MTTNGHFPLRAFFGHHKCATSWIDMILMEVCFHLGLHLEIVHRDVQFEDAGTLADYVREHDANFVAYTNAKIEQANTLPLHKGFHVVRDPRDVLVSAYFSHRHSHPTNQWPELAKHREELNTLGKEEGLFCEMDFSREEFEDMTRWDYTQENVLELKMEELTANPIEGFTEILDFLDMLDQTKTRGIQRLLKSATLKVNRLLYKGRHVMPNPTAPPKLRARFSIPTEKLHAIVKEKSFSKLSGGRKRGDENVKSHYRKGVPGDWRNHFTDDHIRVFKERHNDLLIKLGYESDGDW